MTVSKTGFYTHEDCRKHEMGPGHPECPERLDAIQDRLLVSGVSDALEHLEAPLASLNDIELAHDRLHVAALRGLTLRLVEEQAAGGPEHTSLDSDTSINAHTWTAALRSAGAAMAATDAVLAGELENAFCMVRPPGHHATRSKAMGFCFFNNVAVAAKYALQRHNLQRVAVIDFDVHHGNGTENIFKDDPRVLMVSIFQHPFYPYSGADNPAPNMVNVPIKAGSRGDVFREIVTDIWMPALRNHAPEMIFISAGFDAHYEDDMGSLGLVEADYMWATEQLKKVAAEFSGRRIVSMLEGGYSLSSLARSVVAHIKTLADL